MKKYLFAFIMLLYGSAAFSADYENLVAKTKYTANEKAQITALFKKAEHMGLPADMLANKVKEAALKRVRFNVLLHVMEQRLSLMGEAAAVISAKNMPVKNRPYALQVLTELQEEGVTRLSYERMLNAAISKRRDFDEVAKYFDVLGKYHPGDIPGEHYADILAACIGKNISPEKGEKLLYMLTQARRNNMPLDSAKELILNGIAQNRRLEEISDTIQSKGSQEEHLSENTRRKQELEYERSRSFSRDEYRGGTENGGNGMRRGR